MQLYGAVRATQPAWRRASFCASGECVEVTRRDGMIFVRSSSERWRPALRYTPEEFRSFANGIKAGEFDDLLA
jgi:hypothetical protein